VPNVLTNAAMQVNLYSIDGAGHGLARPEAIRISIQARRPNTCTLNLVPIIACG